jgi:hypothetical protein
MYVGCALFLMRDVKKARACSVIIDNFDGFDVVGYDNEIRSFFLFVIAAFWSPNYCSVNFSVVWKRELVGFSVFEAKL